MLFVNMKLDLCRVPAFALLLINVNESVNLFHYHLFGFLLLSCSWRDFFLSPPPPPPSLWEFLLYYYIIIIIIIIIIVMIGCLCQLWD